MAKIEDGILTVDPNTWGYFALDKDQPYQGWLASALLLNYEVDPYSTDSTERTVYFKLAFDYYNDFETHSSVYILVDPENKYGLAQAIKIKEYILNYPNGTNRYQEITSSSFKVKKAKTDKSYKIPTIWICLVHDDTPSYKEASFQTIYEAFSEDYDYDYNSRYNFHSKFVWEETSYNAGDDIYPGYPVIKDNNDNSFTITFSVGNKYTEVNYTRCEYYWGYSYDDNDMTLLYSGDSASAPLEQTFTISLSENPIPNPLEPTTMVCAKQKLYPTRGAGSGGEGLSNFNTLWIWQYEYLNSTTGNISIYEDFDFLWDENTQYYVTPRIWLHFYTGGGGGLNGYYGYRIKLYRKSEFFETDWELVTGLKAILNYDANYQIVLGGSEEYLDIDLENSYHECDLILYPEDLEIFHPNDKIKVVVQRYTYTNRIPGPVGSGDTIVSMYKLRIGDEVELRELRFPLLPTGTASVWELKNNKFEVIFEMLFSKNFEKYLKLDSLYCLVDDKKLSDVVWTIGEDETNKNNLKYSYGKVFKLRDFISRGEKNITAEVGIYDSYDLFYNAQARVLLKLIGNIMRVKLASGWKDGEVYVKTSSGWKAADAICVKTSDGWKEST